MINHNRHCDFSDYHFALKNLLRILNLKRLVDVTKIFPVVLMFIILVFQNRLLVAQDEFDRLNQSSDWMIQFTDPGTDNWKDHWFLDGEMATVENGERGMHFIAGSVGRDDAHHAVLWTQMSFEGDVKIEYNYTRTDSQAIYVNILYIQATGINNGPYDKDISKWNELRTVPSMSKYYKYMRTLHISYAAFNMVNDDSTADYIRIRQYPVTEKITFKLLEIPPTFYETGLFQTGVTYKITVIKTSSRLYFTIEGAGNTKKFSWDLNKPESVNEGRIGLRHMYTRSATYKNFMVSVKQ